MPESVQSCFELSMHFPVFFFRELFLEQFTAGSQYRQTYGKFETRLDAFWHSYIPPIFFLKILFLVPNVSNSWLFQKRCFMKIIWHRISKQTLLFRACLPTRQNGVENRDKAYYFSVSVALLYLYFDKITDELCKCKSPTSDSLPS